MAGTGVRFSGPGHTEPTGFLGREHTFFYIGFVLLIVELQDRTRCNKRVVCEPDWISRSEGTRLITRS